MADNLRPHLVRALEADLVGPYSLEHSSTERLPRPPLRWYMAGFLAPADSAPLDPLDEEGEVGDGSDDEDDSETGAQEQTPRQPKRLPSSIGLSVFLRKGATEVHATVSYAEYEHEPAEGDERASWLRRPCGPFEVDVPLDKLARGIKVAPGIVIEGNVADVKVSGAEGTLAVTLFLVNRRPVPHDKKQKLDTACIFQVALGVRAKGGLEARPNRRDETSRELDERIADLQYREHMEWVVGHGVAAEPIREGRAVVGARNTWLPTHNVLGVKPHDLGAEITTDMTALADLDDGVALRKALENIPVRYAEWISEQRKIPLDSEPRRDARETLAIQMDWAKKRIEDGIALLATDADARSAFRIANLAMADAAKARSPDRYKDGPPKWRLFQLAVLLLRLTGVAKAETLDRGLVDLIFFPTGGGKTEAYLGVIAFALTLRRIRGTGHPDRGLGVD
jgi:hypothetical protein